MPSETTPRPDAPSIAEVKFITTSYLPPPPEDTPANGSWVDRCAEALNSPFVLTVVGGLILAITIHTLSHFTNMRIKERELAVEQSRIDEQRLRDLASKRETTLHAFINEFRPSLYAMYEVSKLRMWLGSDVSQEDGVTDTVGRSRDDASRAFLEASRRMVTFPSPESFLIRLEAIFDEQETLDRVGQLRKAIEAIDTFYKVGWLTEEAYRAKDDELEAAMSACDDAYDAVIKACAQELDAQRRRNQEEPAE